MSGKQRTSVAERTSVDAKLVVPDNEQEPVRKASSQPELSLSEALSILGHLQERGLLCKSCGYRMVEWVNQVHSHCSGCKRDNASYNPISGKVSDFEKILCGRLQGWVERFIFGASE